MHKFLRAVGFSQYTEKKQVQKLIRDIIIHADERSYTTVGKKTLVAEFDRNFAEDIGIAVCGEFDEDDTYSFDYYLPYLRSDLVSTAEDISIERHAAKESYAGICDDPKVGVSLIFYLQNIVFHIFASYHLYGSAASRRPSPTKLKAKTAITTNRPGIISHG